MNVGTAMAKGRKTGGRCRGVQHKETAEREAALAAVCCPNLAPGAIVRVHGRDTALPRDRKQVTPSVALRRSLPALPSLATVRSHAGIVPDGGSLLPLRPFPDHPNSRDDPGGYSSGNARYPLQRLRLPGA